MDPRYKNTHLKLLAIGFLSFFRYLGKFIYFGINKKGVVRSYPFLVSFFQIGELSLSLGVPCYTLEIMLSPILSFLGKCH